jgi:hypothetical protein
MFGARKKMPLAKGYNPNMFGLAEEALEKSSGHPLLDRIRTAFRQVTADEEVNEQWLGLQRAALQEPRPEEIHVQLTVTTFSTPKSQDEMLEMVLGENPDIAAQYEQDEAFRQQVQRELAELGPENNRFEQVHAVRVPMPAEDLHAICEVIQKHIPNPDTKPLADLLRAAATELDGRE